MVTNQRDNHHREHCVFGEIFLLDDSVGVVDLRHVLDCSRVCRHEVMATFAKEKSMRKYFLEIRVYVHEVAVDTDQLNGNGVDLMDQL